MNHLQPTTISVSARGKLMLLGEHAVVYGYPCLVAAVNRSLEVSVAASTTGDHLETPGILNPVFVQHALTVFRKRTGYAQKVWIHTESELGTYGLGSSAAVTVATVAALAKLAHHDLSREELFHCAYEVVKDVQRTASGFDIAASMWGGTSRFDGKTKQVLPLSTKALPIIAGYSGVKGGTVQLIQHVAYLKKEHPSVVESVFTRIRHLVDAVQTAIQENDWEEVGSCMNEAQKGLVHLGVVTQQLEKMIQAARAAGAYGAKISGAGGGDCIIAVVAPEKRDAVQKAIRKVNGEVLDIEIGTGKGVL